MELITSRVKKIVKKYHPSESQWFIDELQEYCEYLAKFSDDERKAESFERICFAILKLGKTSKEKFIQALELGKIDFRDVLVNAGFGNSLTVHNDWADSVLKDKNT